MAGKRAETLEQQVAAGKAAQQDWSEREGRIASGEMELSDGFVSQWAAQMTSQKGGLAERIAENGGKWHFARYELIDLGSGEPIEGARLANTQFGLAWAWDEGRATRWATAHTARQATQAKKGVAERIVIVELEARADLWSPPGARGLSGATQVRAVIEAADFDERRNTSPIGATREDAEAWLEEFGGWREVRWAA